MGFLAHVKQNWLGLLVAALGIGLSVYFYVESRQSREPVFAVAPTRIEIVSAANVATAPIKVLRQDNTPIRADVNAVRVFFWNAGKIPIRPDDVLDTVQITLQDSASEILDFKLLRTSRPIAAITLERGPNPRTLRVGFRILERGDGFAAQIIYQGSGKVPVGATGAIVGAAIRSVGPASLGGDLGSTVGWGAVAGAIAASTIVVLALGVKKFGQGVAILQKPVVEWLLVLVVVGSALAFGTYEAVKHDPTRMANYVPVGIIP